MKFVKLLLVLLAIPAGTAFAEWTSIGPVGGPIYAGAVGNDSPLTIYAAPCYYPMKIARSTDGGETWRFTAGQFSNYVTVMAVDPDNSDVVYAVTTNTLRKTTDGGESWAQLPTPASHNITGVDLNPLNPAVVYVSATCSSRVVVARSTDAGATWQSFVCGSTGLSAGRVAADPVDTNVVYCAGYASDRRTVAYRSTDRGATWTSANAGNGYMPFDMLVSAADHRIILIGTFSSGVLRSTDAGATWAQAGAVRDFVYSIAESPRSPGVFYAGTNLGVYRSVDAGATWALVGTGLGKDIYAVLADPGEDSIAYSASRAGMYRSSDRGSTWQALMRDFPFHQIGAVAPAPSDAGIVYAESKENAVYSSLDNGGTWTRLPDFLSCGFVCGFVVDPTDARTVWALEGFG
jgi:photosystem II stability/assembly factor-like uncharacterized protein